MPRDPKQPRGGKREKRRLAAVQRQLDSGEIPAEDFKISKSLSGYTFEVGGKQIGWTDEEVSQYLEKNPHGEGGSARGSTDPAPPIEERPWTLLEEPRPRAKVVLKARASSTPANIGRRVELKACPPDTWRSRNFDPSQRGRSRSKKRGTSASNKQPVSRSPTPRRPDGNAPPKGVGRAISASPTRSVSPSPKGTAAPKARHPDAVPDYSPCGSTYSRSECPSLRGDLKSRSPSYSPVHKRQKRAQSVPAGPTPTPSRANFIELYGLEKGEKLWKNLVPQLSPGHRKSLGISEEEARRVAVSAWKERGGDDRDLSRPRASEVDRDLSRPRASEVDQIRPHIGTWIRVAVDLHWCLDGGQNKCVPGPNKDSLDVLKDFNLSPWICSYIGTEGTQSAERRTEAESSRLECAKWLHGGDKSYLVADPQRPSSWGLHLKIVDRKLYNVSKEEGGKAVALLAEDTFILIDDNLEIAKEAEAAGILVYHIRAHKKAKAFYSSVFSEGQDSTRNFVEAVNAVVSDAEQGTLRGKLELVWEKRTFRPTYYRRVLDIAAPKSTKHRAKDWR